MASIEKRSRNGRVSYSVRYRDPGGHSRRKVFARKVDAARWLAENEAARNRGAWVDPAAGRDRLGEWAERWFSSTVALRPVTRRTYRLLLDNQILPHFGGTTLASIDPLAVHEWQAGLVAGGLSPSRIRNAAQVLGQILDAAVAGGRLHRNPAQGLRRPRIVQREMTFLSAAELERLASQIADPYGVLVRFLGWTGLRIGEAAALRVGRLDLLGRRVEVVEAATEVNGRLAWGPTKTGERRTVPLPAFWSSCSAPTWPTGLTRSATWCSPCQAAARCGPPSGVSGTSGQPWRRQGRPWASASMTFGTPRLPWRSESASVKIVQAMLGHRSATQTLDRYGHCTRATWTRWPSGSTGRTPPRPRRCGPRVAPPSSG
jgi:integrase